MNKFQSALDGMKEQIENATGMKIESDDTFYEWVESLQELIDHCEVLEKHFADQHNTDEFKHFKLHSDSTLKSLTKAELIGYIHMVYHNWQGTDEAFYNVMAYANMLDKALDKACEKLEHDTVDECKCWREWFMYLAKPGGYRNGNQ